MQQKCKALKIPFLYFDPKQRTIYKKDPIVLKQLGLAMVAVENGKSVHQQIERQLPIPERPNDQTYEEKYNLILGLGENLVGQCCESCREKYANLSRRTFEVENREDYLAEIATLKQEIAQGNFHQKFDSIFPRPSMLKKYDEHYQEQIEEIKNLVVEQFLGDSFVFAMEYWDDMDEDFVLFVHGKNDGEDEEVSFLMQLFSPSP
jgi:hypothetical protein